MTVDPIPSCVPSFSVDFWQPYAAVVPAGPLAQGTQADGTTDAAGPPRLSYSAQQHGTHAAFCQGENFARYKAEVAENLAFLVTFCRQHDMSDANEIEENFDTFFRHRFEDVHYFSTRAEMVDAVGKQSLDEFCSMIRNEAADVGRRKASILDLSRGVTLCADGAVSNLVSAACMLAKAVGGVRGKLWELKEEIVGNILRQLLNRQFGRANNYAGNEIHYVNTAWNLLADEFGLAQIPDGIKIAEVDRDADLLATCAARISGALTPDRLAGLIAEACLAHFNSRMIANKTPFTGEWTPGIERACSETLEEIGNEFGLTSADALVFDDDAQTATLRASDLRMKSFLDIRENNEIKEDDEIKQDDNTGAEAQNDARQAKERDGACIYTYAVRSEPSLIALDVLRAMDAMKLLQPQTGPRNGGEWVDEHRTRAALFDYGELAWILRTTSAAAFQEPMWNSGNAEFGQITVPDLLQWQAARAPDTPLPPAAAIRQAVYASDPAQLMQMPAHWLEEAEDLQRLLQRLGAEKSAAYLATNLPILGAVGAGYTNQDRDAVLSTILRMGLANTVRDLAEQWQPNALWCTDMIYVVLLREAVPALHQAMLAEDPKAAVQAWYQPLCESGLLTLLGRRAIALLKSRYSGSLIFCHVLSNGHAAAVEAFHALVKNLLDDATVRWHMRDELPELLTAPDAHYVPALFNAMFGGRTAAVTAFYAGLEDLLTDPDLALTIRPALLQALPDLLVGRKNFTESGLAFAIEHGNTGVIEAFHAMVNRLLSEPDIAEHVQLALPSLLAAKFRSGGSALSEAMVHRTTPAIKAFHAMLKHPGILPHIRDVMPELLNGMDSYGKTGLSNALEHGRAGNIEEYHALLRHLLNEPTIAPLIRRSLPRLLTATNSDGTSGLRYASKQGHTAAITAYHAMRNDPLIRLPLEEDTPEVLTGETPERNPKVALPEGTGP